MTRCLTPFLALLACALLLAGCSGWRHGPDGPTIAHLPEARLPEPGQVIVGDMDRDRIEHGYRRALAVAEDPALRLHILLRLADLEMARAEHLQEQSGEVRRFFEQAVVMYRELIALQSDQAIALDGLELDQLYYKLAKAYAMDGRLDESAEVLDQLAAGYPDSVFYPEVQFRRAERAFAEGDYFLAEQHYRSVVQGRPSAFDQNALYMQGWSLFKLTEYRDSLVAFTGVLDQLIPTGQPGQVEPVLAGLSNAQRNLADDTLRVSAMAFAYLDGAPAIAQLQQDLGVRAYQHLFYDQLGERYLEQRRYRDSAATFEHFVEHNPDSDFAPAFSVRAIAVYERGNFPSLIRPAKEAYVQRYGFYSHYWENRAGQLPEGADGEGADGYLHQYLQELASYEHSRAQQLRARSGSDPAEVRTAYARAADWYEEFVLTFPEDPARPEMVFLLAESLYEAGEQRRALSAYEEVAYQHRDPVRGAESGYAMILLAAELAAQAQLALAQVSGGQVSEGQVSGGQVSGADVTNPEALLAAEQALSDWQQHKIEHGLRFADTYPEDNRVPVVLTDAATELLAQGQGEEAAQVAERVLALEPPADTWLQLSAWLVLGHSHYDRQHFVPAEQAYWQALALLPGYESRAGAPTAEGLRERIAASIYRRGELALAEGETQEAVALWLSVGEVTPGTEIAIRAHYDAGYYLMQLEDWARAESVLLSFRAQFPNHPLAVNLPARLSAVYQAQEKWPQAAAELRALAASTDDPETARQADLLAAELYDRAGDRNRTLESYRHYVDHYPSPLADNLEAQYRLTQLYAERGDTRQRDAGLQRLIDTDARAGDARTGRSQWLAAYAATELAQAPYEAFASIPLRLPLRDSLQRKRAALDRALQAQERILAYGIAEFSTRASFQIGEIYAQLSRDLMDSQRPPELNPLELEQYDILLEEQAYPFEERAIEIHEANTRRSWNGLYDNWVKNSFDSLSKLLPGRYRKTEKPLEVSHDIY